MASGPLDGIKILEFSIILSGPFGGLQLADMGADIVKVEQPPAGDPSRHTNAVIPGSSKFFQMMNRGKQSLVVNLREQRGREVIHRMIPETDVLLINYRPGVAKRLGIDYETLRAIRPDLIYADIAGFGFEGPIAHHAASDIVASAYGGAVALTNAVDEFGAPMQNQPGTVGDLPTGLAATMSILAALFHRERTGEGQLVKTSLLRAVMMMTAMSNMRDPVSDISQRDPVVEAMNRVRAEGGSYADLVEARQLGRPINPYFTTYRAKDGGLVLGALTPLNREAIRTILGLEGADSDEPGYDPTDPATREMMLERKQQVQEIMLTRTVAEWMQAFNDAGAPAAPVNFPEELIDDPQASTLMVDVEHPLAGTTRQIGPMFEMEKSPTAVTSAAPVLGADTDAVLAATGYSADEVASLREDGVVA